ncbi:Deoxyribose-phosphate aldolase [Pseudocercospora fuligena]|uniref:deoxyribose-phosphate aldolase n=1 Tax=Pseudocercospora fuligena TaxID=685502 RepID=A0A8H6R7X0_9PEZI|nr:Deoxyribose-phosphate aldolase [Pseudocercospora fuligena]
MTTRYTDDEWSKIIADAETSIKVDSSNKYPIPEIGSEDFTRTVDHTLLKLDAKSNQFDDLCAEARVNKFATVCVRPNWVQKCVTDLKGSGVSVASVVGFHEGTHELSEKLSDVQISLSSGATELDIVINWTDLKKKQYEKIYTELSTLRTSAPPPVLCKLILETSQLTPEDIVAGCVLANAASFDFVKTSTGFCGGGAKEGDVRLMKTACEKLGNGKMNVKASGGIRTLEDAVKMLEAGASRLGTSEGVWIAKEARERVEGAKNGGEGERPGMATRLFTDY